MIDRRRGVAVTEVDAGPYGPVQHFESDYHFIIDYYKLDTGMVTRASNGRSELRVCWDWLLTCKQFAAHYPNPGSAGSTSPTASII